MNKQLYYRLIALWVISEAMLGGIIHGLRIPVSGLLVGSCAVVCICLIAWYAPVRGAIIKATIIVAIFKMMLSPQAPPMAYAAVFFQGLLGELLFRNKKYFTVTCILFAVLALLESGLQRILVLTIIYGNDLWVVINDFINGLTKQKTATNYSLLIGSSYVLLHLITGIVVGWWAAHLPKRVERWRKEKQFILNNSDNAVIAGPETSAKKKRLKNTVLIIWLLLIALYVQSYFHIGEPLLPAHLSLKILLRSLIIVLGWVFIIGPLVKQLLHRWLQRKKSEVQEEVQEVLNLLPATQQLIAQSWKTSAGAKGPKRINDWSKILLVNALTPPAIEKVWILTGPIQSGKTTSLVKWTENRNDVYGILTPLVEGKRVFMNVQSRQLFLMEAKEGETETLTVGRFIFSKNNFSKAVQIIRDGIDKDGWLIIDEIGPLELKGEGFAEILKEVLLRRQHKIILVIRDRDGMVEMVKEYFGLKNPEVLKDIAEPRL